MLQEHNLKAYKIAVRQILFQNCAAFQFKGGTFMENVVIGNATYVVSRVFIGDRNVSEKIQKRVEICSKKNDKTIGGSNFFSRK